jgi:hypothetical protein
MKIQRNIALLAVVFGMICISFTGAKLKKIIPYVGVQNEIVLGTSTQESLRKKFGNDYKTRSYYTKENDHDSTLYSTAIAYENLGLKFFFRPANKHLFAAYFYKNYPAATEKGIQAGISTLEDVEKAYGKTDWIITMNSISLEYSGLFFYVTLTDGFRATEEAMEKAKLLKVEYISVELPQ